MSKTAGYKLFASMAEEIFTIVVKQVEKDHPKYKEITVEYLMSILDIDVKHETRSNGVVSKPSIPSSASKLGNKKTTTTAKKSSKTWSDERASGQCHAQGQKGETKDRFCPEKRGEGNMFCKTHWGSIQKNSPHYTAVAASILERIANGDDDDITDDEDARNELEEADIVAVPSKHGSSKGSSKSSGKKPPTKNIKPTPKLVSKKKKASKKSDSEEEDDAKDDHLESSDDDKKKRKIHRTNVDKPTKKEIVPRHNSSKKSDKPKYNLRAAENIEGVKDGLIDLDSGKEFIIRKDNDYTKTGRRFAIGKLVDGKFVEKFSDEDYDVAKKFDIELPKKKEEKKPEKKEEKKPEKKEEKKEEKKPEKKQIAAMEDSSDSSSDESVNDEEDADLELSSDEE